MALTDLIFGPKREARVGLVQFDCSVSETHASEATITDHPVEEGADISDHIRLGPKSLEINGLVSNTPVVFLAGLLAPSPLVGDLTPVTDRTELAYAELERVMAAGEVVDVVTSLRDYENMAIASMAIARDVENGNVLNCSLSLREIIVAQTETVVAPEPVDVSNKVPADKGKTVKKAAETKQAEQSESVLRSFAGSLFGS